MPAKIYLSTFGPSGFEFYSNTENVYSTMIILVLLPMMTHSVNETHFG